MHGSNRTDITNHSRTSQTSGSPTRQDSELLVAAGPARFATPGSAAPGGTLRVRGTRVRLVLLGRAPMLASIGGRARVGVRDQTCFGALSVVALPGPGRPGAGPGEPITSYRSSNALRDLGHVVGARDEPRAGSRVGAESHRHQVKPARAMTGQLGREKTQQDCAPKLRMSCSRVCALDSRRQSTRATRRSALGPEHRTDYRRTARSSPGGRCAVARWSCKPRHLNVNGIASR